MRRNALKNRKLSQTKKWRQEKQRRSGKHPLKSSSTAKQRRTVPLLSQVTLKDLRVRVRRHSLDFLLNCKDPKSKERALLLQLEEVRPQDNRPRGLNMTGEESNSSAVNLKPFTLNSSMSACQKSRSAVRGAGLNGRFAKVVGRKPVHMRTSSRTKSSVRTTLAHQTKSSNTTNTTTVCHPDEGDKICSAIKQENVETAITESQNRGAIETSVITTVQNPAAEQTERKTIRALSTSNTDGLKNTGDNPLISLKQYLTVNLTRLSVSQSLELGESCEDRKVRVEVRGRRMQSQRPGPATEKRASRFQQRQARSSEVCTADGNRGVREMSFKSPDQTSVRKRHSSESTGDLSHSEKKRSEKFSEIQTASVDDKDFITNEQTDFLKGKTEGQRDSKSNRNLEEVKRSDCKMVSSKCQNNVQDVKNTAKGVCTQEGSGQMSLSTQPVSRHEDDIVIKQATVLLSDILRKDKSLIDGRLKGGNVGRRFSTWASKESAEEESEQTEINGGRFRRSVQRRIIRRRKIRPRAVKRKAADKPSTKGHLSKDITATVKTELSQESVEPKLPQRHNDPPATCLNPLPHKSLISAKTTTNPDTNAQVHAQSNIPLKKRTFRSSALDSEQSLNSALDQVSKNVTELKSSAVLRQDLAPSSGESSKVKRENKVRVRRTEMQRLAPRRHSSFNRVLRSRPAEAQRGHLMRNARKCKLERLDEDDAGKAQTLESERVEDVAESLTSDEFQSRNQGKLMTLEQSGLEDIKPDFFKIRLKRRRGKVWEMQSAGLENMALKAEKGDELVAFDPFKAIMDSVSILNMEMEAAQAHVQASKKSKSRLHRLKKRGEKLQAINFYTGAKSDKDLENDRENVCGPDVSASNEVQFKEKIDRDPVVGVKQLLEKTESQKNDSTALSAAALETKIEEGFLKSSCLFESGSQKKQEPELDINGCPLPVIKLRRKMEDIWEVDSKEELIQPDLKVETIIKTEMKGHVLGKQKGLSDCCKLKEECPSSERLNNSSLKTEPPPFSLSLSPLSLSSPLNDSKTEVISVAADRITERPEMISGGRKQRHKMDRTHKCGPVETPTTCLSHTLQQIDNSLSRLSEGLCSSQTLEKPTASSNSVIQPPSQSPPFATADNMLTSEPSFTNCCDDILDFQCLNFEGYYQPQNMLPSSPSDLCSLDPPTDPFSSPLSHSPTDTWTTETPYLGPPSPGNNFTSEDLQFFPGLMPSKSDSVPLECEAKDTSKDRNPPNTSFSYSALGNPDLAAKDRIISKNPGMRFSKEDLKNQSFMAPSKPRFMGASSSSVTTQSPVTLPHPAMNIKPSTSQSKTQANLKTQGPFHRMTIPNKSQSFSSNQPNAVRAVSQSCLTKPVQSSQMSNKFLSPQLFTVKNPNPPDNPFNFPEKTSTVIHRVLKFQGGNQSQNLYSAPCKETTAAGSPTVSSRMLGAKSGAMEKTQQSPKFCFSADSHQKGNLSVQGFEKDVHLASSNRSNIHFNKPNSSISHSYSKAKMSSDKHESAEANMAYKNFSILPRQFYFPSKMSDSYSAPHEKSMKQDKSTTPTSDKHQPCYTQQDPFDFSFGTSLSPMSQHNSPQVVHNTPPATPAPANKSSAPSASFPYGYQGPPYVLNFSGDHSLTLGLRDGAEGYPGLGSTNYTYHCLMEPSGTQGRLVVEPCGPQLSNPASLAGFSGLKGHDEHCRKDMQQQCHAGDHQGTSHYGPVTTSHSMGATKPKRVRLVVTDGTVDLDLQYSD